ncbi:MAG: hypothetical protein BWY63_01866 [Chloroflexi bacterium ADurb.Bin360]|nr:MAG: hypothetical protein BWY63_01866 [Chloroflexi bacterium ADurb.Bin360]
MAVGGGCQRRLPRESPLLADEENADDVEDVDAEKQEQRQPNQRQKRKIWVKRGWDRQVIIELQNLDDGEQRLHIAERFRDAPKPVEIPLKQQGGEH